MEGDEMSTATLLRTVSAGMVGVSLSFGVVFADEERDEDVDAAAIQRVNFLVEIDGIGTDSFVSVEGIGFETEVVEFREAGDNAPIQLLVGPTRYSVITLKRAYRHNDDLWKWHKDTIAGTGSFKRNGTIAFREGAGDVFGGYCFYDAFPVEWQVPALEKARRTTDRELPIETVRLAVEGLERFGFNGCPAATESAR
jgi:phage tail-like protein